MSPKYPLLALVARADAYGYELKHAVETEFAPHWKLDFAQLYRALAKLRAEGLVSVRAAAAGEGPERKVYAITAAGRRALKAWTNLTPDSPEEHWVKMRLVMLLGVETKMPLMVSGSDDLLLALLTEMARGRFHTVGSLAGLFELAEGKADVAGTHLWDPDTHQYNVSFIQHIIPEQDILLINLALREYGLLVARGNPKGINTLRDLAKRGVRVVNRAQGTGARLWFHRLVRNAGVAPETIAGWSKEAATYAEVARAIRAGEADAGPALRASADKFALDFISLGKEQFDLAMPRSVYESARGKEFLSGMKNPEFRAYARSLPGYELDKSGRIMAEVKFGTVRKPRTSAKKRRQSPN
jgi:molybdate-binding protein